MTTIPLAEQNLSRYYQALKMLGIDSVPGDDPPTLGKDGAVEDTRWPGYLANSFIIVDPRQGSSSAASTKTALRYANSLAASSIDYLFTNEWRAATEAVLTIEPIIGMVTFQSAEGGGSVEFNDYLQLIARQEFPQWYGERNKDTKGEKEKKRTHEPAFFSTFPGKIVVLYETPSKLISQLCSIRQREQLLQEKPLEYLLDTPFLQTLRDDILRRRQRGMPVLRTLNLNTQRETVALPSLPPQQRLESFHSTLRFKIGQERIYVFGAADSPGSLGRIVGLFSSKEKKQQYFIQDFSFQLNLVDPSGTGKLLQLLAAQGYISLSASSIKAKLDELEQQALRHRGFQLLETNPGQAKRLIRLEVSRMERYHFLQELAAAQRWPEFEAWRTMQDGLRRSQSLDNLPPQQLLPFVQVLGENPALEELLSLLQGKPVEENILEKISRAKKSEQQSIIAEYLSKTDGLGEEERVQHCITELGEQYKYMINSVAAILFGRGQSKEKQPEITI